MVRGLMGRGGEGGEEDYGEGHGGTAGGGIAKGKKRKNLTQIYEIHSGKEMKKFRLNFFGKLSKSNELSKNTRANYSFQL